MSDMERYDGQLIERKPAKVGLSQFYPAVPASRDEEFGMPSGADSDATSNLVVGILRRWYIVLLVFIIICAIGIPAIWLSVKPVFTVTGAIRLAQIIPNILTGEADKGEISNYQSFMNTQAGMITINRVVQRVADDLVDENLTFFRKKAANPVTRLTQVLEDTGKNAEIAGVLKSAISSGVISAAPARRTELIKITMKDTNPQEAKQIVDAFISAYMAVEVSNSAAGQDRKLGVLEDERKVLTEKLQSQREAIHQLAQEYGTTALAGRQDMMLQRVTALLAELTKIEANRINLEAQVQLFSQTKEQTIEPEELLRMRSEYVNADPIIKELTRNIVNIENDLIAAQQLLTPDNPALKQKQAIMDALKSRLEDKRKEVAKAFDDLASAQFSKAGEERLLSIQAQLEQIKAYEQRLREVLGKEDAQTIQLGRKQLRIEDLQFQMGLDKELYDTVCLRIREMEMERKRPARVSVAYNADVEYIRDKRVKYSAALTFGALAFGMGLAYLRDKADKSVRSPDDVAKRIGIRIIGTTASPQSIKPALLEGQIVGDYQTIRANLGLFNGEGTPKRLVITSPGTQEGKTTLAINLARSMSRTGKKVLLIDGDLRKPDIAHLLNLPHGSRGLQDVLFGKDFKLSVYSVPSTTLDVLACDFRNRTDAYELLTLPLTVQRINDICRDYDHVIIDTPPVLAFPDALVWARMADAVILGSFAGQTSAAELAEANERLAQINVKVLGTVLNNVRITESYYRYGNYYYTQGTRSKRNNKRVRSNLLISTGNPEDDDSDGLLT